MILYELNYLKNLGWIKKQSITKIQKILDEDVRQAYLKLYHRKLIIKEVKNEI